ncbi:MAG: DUF5106 domain-containing protein [Bacteroides sp.]|nr:DUF5106 domain-containing protein [Bacteroides sp.]
MGCAKNNQTIPSAPAEDYPLPSVSPSIRDPHERASTICARFWDDAVFPPADVPADSVSPALQQAMANFAAIASMASSPDSIAAGVNQMLKKGGIDRIMPLAERYLFDPNSPLRSEETFLYFLQAAPQWERTELLLPQVLKNRVGTTAADFPYVDSNGRCGTLHEFLRTHGETLVYFFDSECNVCKGLIPRAAEAAQGRSVIAVCPEVNAAAFNEVLPLFPKDWTVVRDIGQIDAQELYIFPAMPSAYILSPAAQVLAKDLPL